jgi:hypothetical protein
VIEVLAAVTRVPLEADDAVQVKHECILPSYTEIGSRARRGGGVVASVTAGAAAGPEAAWDRAGQS